METAHVESLPSRAPTDRLDDQVRQVCDAVGGFIEYWGFKAILGRIWTLLALRVEPMTQVEIAEFLDVSRSLVSGAMSELTKRGLVRATSNHRSTPYEAVVDIWPSISDVLRSREWMLIESARVALEAAIEEVELAPAGLPARYQADRMRFLLRMTELAQAFLRLLIGIRVPRKLEGIGDWLKSSAKLMQGLRELR
ncbi:MAG TPA: MarR family transcriptional regulator [Polyangiaceae bacterium]|nr:MarR family transcriptional regulator [Polyangiaceae bacterium]